MRIDAEEMLLRKAIFPFDVDRPAAECFKRGAGILAIVSPQTRRRELRMESMMALHHADVILLDAIAGFAGAERFWDRQGIEIALNLNGGERWRGRGSGLAVAAFGRIARSAKRAAEAEQPQSLRNSRLLDERIPPRMGLGLRAVLGELRLTFTVSSAPPAQSRVN